MKIIVGLGNPGSKYAVTRHNVGFLTLDIIADSLSAVFKEKDHALQALVDYCGEKILLLKPLTFMNLSGHAVIAAVNFYKIDQEDMLIIYDDMDLEPGRIRLRRGGSAGGHNGMGSIIEQLGDNKINRLKIGIGHSPYVSGSNYVLSRFNNEEMPLLANTIKNAAEAALFWAKNGISAAMNKYNIKEGADNKKEK
ncbi:MAG: aminoacyl-tRNA hydrolase [Bacillota bacterium]|jgi:PTH1 family peptidyl-tRNA hydrolase